MLDKRYYIWLVVALSALLPSSSFAQGALQTMNTFSTYTMYGLGELQTPGTLSTRSMGGAGVAQRNAASINLLNPASYSMALQKGILFEFGVEGATHFASQRVDGRTLRSNYTTANFHDISLQLPIAKGLGFGFSLSPYSSVGYTQRYTSLMTNVGFLEMVNSGSGDITEVKFGLGWRVAKRLSLGFAAQYYWGDISRYFTASVTGITAPGVVLSTVGVDNLSVSKFKGQVGMQYSVLQTKKHVLNLGATYDIGGDLNPRSARVVNTMNSTSDIYAQSDTTRVSLVMPRQLAVGVNYSSSSIVVSADYSYQNWGDENDEVEFTGSGMDVVYNNVRTIKAGVEYTPKRSDVRKYYNRINYRLGARLGGYQYKFGGEELKQLSVTAGFGLPLNMIGITKVNVGVEWMTMGSTKNIMVDTKKIGLVKQDQIRFSLAFTMFGDDYWFQRQQIN